MKRKLKLVAFQSGGFPGNPTKNIELIETTLKSNPNADLIAFPELFLGGYNLTVDETRNLAEPVDGSSNKVLC